MKITILAVGKCKEKYWRDALAEYEKRLGRYHKLTVEEVADEKTPENASPAENIQIKEKEGERLLSKIPDGAYVIALAIEGELLSSEEFAARLEKLAVTGTSHVIFVIGGSLGLSQAVLARADRKISFGRMTYPHQLMRVILAEQIYRAAKIARGEPYHK